MEYNFREIEKKWHQKWVENKTYKVTEDENKKKFYVLNMFPYPSGAGLHVGHPLGYIASDIYARYKRLNGFNVLNPMGYDAYGLPAEQYAIQTGQHPEVTTVANINRYREQLDKIGFCFDWDREVRTCDPKYYHWTQWAFQKMFNSFFCNSCQKAQPIEKLIKRFEEKGSADLNVAQNEQIDFTAEEWNSFDDVKKQQILMNYRIAYLGETMVNWCPGLGTVLANDEVVNGVSERGGYPVIQKKMQQWCLRTSAYSQRLLDGLETIQWSDSIKETQKNWIGRSEGTEVEFSVKDSDVKFTIFTTRADTMFGVTFMVLAPESEYVQQVTTAEQKEEVEKYLDYVKKRTELDRMANHSVTGVFSGSYAINPFTGEAIPVWISDYVLAGYGTGAIMAVPAHDSRDYAFAKHFGLEIRPLVEGCDVSEESFDAKEGIVTNSPVAGKSSMDGFSLNGLTVKEAIAATKKFVTEKGIGRVKVNYRLRDAIFSRQRYWGEPFPVYYKDGMPQMVPEECLPLELPEIETYKPTETGEPPLGRAKKWAWDAEKKEVVDKSLVDNKTVFPLELNTMPGFAGSSAYYLRYMDPHNDEALVSKEADEYWQNVDLYVGGCEHATGHLIYSRFWNKFLFDLGVSCKEEPFQKLVNQGMIQGRSNFVYRINSDDHDKAPVFVSLNLKKDYDVTPIHVDVNIVSNDILDVEAFRNWRPDYKNAEFILEDGRYICGWTVEKMSKSMYNVVNPDDVVKNYGADALRFNLITGNSPGNDMRFYVEKCEAMRNFCNKIWNASRFVMMNLTIDKNELPEKLEIEDKWILSKLNDVVKEVCENMDAFELGVAAGKIYDFIWDSYCDWYIELTKPRLSGENEESKLAAQKVLLYVLTEILKLLHPFMPFITEEIWQALPHEGEALMIERYPEYRSELSFPADEQNFEMVMTAIKAVRARRSEMNVPPSRKAHLIIATEKKAAFEAGSGYICKLAYASEVSVVDAPPAGSESMVSVITDNARMFMPMAELVDLDKERARIAKELANAEKQLAGQNAKLENQNFVSRAPEAVVNAEREKKAKLEALIENLRASLAALG